MLVEAVDNPANIGAIIRNAAGLGWDERAAHSAIYDAEVTADLFCQIVNRFRPIYESVAPLPPSAPDEPDPTAA